MENSETKGWLKFAFSCNYLSLEKHDELVTQSDEIGKLLNHMIKYPEKFGSL